MALRAVHASDVPCLDDVPEAKPRALATTSAFCKPDCAFAKVCRISNDFLVIGHRGNGMNQLGGEQGQAVRENTLTAFNEAIRNGAKFIEFDVQVTRNGKAVLFHDDEIITNENGFIMEKAIEELSLEEFHSYGIQKENHKPGKPLLRRDQDGKIKEWRVIIDGCLCTLKEALDEIDKSIGFNIEVKFNDEILYTEERLKHALQIILEEVHTNSNGRLIFFSSFHPDAAQLLRKLQDLYPVFFLTKGGTKIFSDSRRNSLEAAIEVSKNGGLQGIVSEAKAIFKNPAAVSKIKESGLGLLTYGQLNNSVEAVYIQHQIGIDGVIVDFVKEVTEAVAEFGLDHSSQDGKILVPESPYRYEGRYNLPEKSSAQHLAFILNLGRDLVQN